MLYFVYHRKNDFFVEKISSVEFTLCTAPRPRLRGIQAGSDIFKQKIFILDKQSEVSRVPLLIGYGGH